MLSSANPTRKGPVPGWNWCAGRALGWVLDNDEDQVSLDAPFLGFDMTAVLDDVTRAVRRWPTCSIGLRRWWTGGGSSSPSTSSGKRSADPASGDRQRQAEDIRKLNGAVVLATQSPADALRSPIAHSIIEQCPTQILLPNDRADPADYIDGLKLTWPEYEAIREELTTGGRRFLLKQGNVSVARELDMSGMDDLVAVLSGRARTVRLMEELITELGPEPEAWLPVFRREWRRAAA